MIVGPRAGQEATRPLAEALRHPNRRLRLAAADAINNYLVDLMRVERAVGQFTFFVSEEESEAWIAELEEYAARR